jgi:hypothetical protein
MTTYRMVCTQIMEIADAEHEPAPYDPAWVVVDEQCTRPRPVIQGWPTTEPTAPVEKDRDEMIADDDGMPDRRQPE